MRFVVKHGKDMNDIEAEKKLWRMNVLIRTQRFSCYRSDHYGNGWQSHATCLLALRRKTKRICSLSLLLPLASGLWLFSPPLVVVVVVVVVSRVRPATVNARRAAILCGVAKGIESD